MKKTLIAALVCIAITSGADAMIRTVDNNPGSPAPYTTIDDAMAAAASNDAIYVQGSATSYGSFTITKKLVFIGAGYTVTGTQSNQPSLINDIVLGTGAHGTVIIGFFLSSLNGQGPLNNNIMLDRNYINSILAAGSGWFLRNNVIGGLSMNTSVSNMVAANNIFRGGINGGSNVSGTIVFNNNFFNTGGNSMLFLEGAQFDNNIFHRSAGSGSIFLGVTNCSFNNNVLYGSETGSNTLPPPGNIGNANMNNVNPMQTNVPDPFMSTQAHLYDYSLQPGSPAINAGSDNTNIGPSGGAYPMSIFNGVPAFPQVQQVNINTGTVSQGSPA